MYVVGVSHNFVLVDSPRGCGRVWRLYFLRVVKSSTTLSHNDRVERMFYGELSQSEYSVMAKFCTGLLYAKC